jgi:hypothetical protein
VGLGARAVQPSLPPALTLHRQRKATDVRTASPENSIAYDHGRMIGGEVMGIRSGGAGRRVGHELGCAGLIICGPLLRRQDGKESKVQG